jgi:LSD1 subclass zinc finger protein
VKVFRCRNRQCRAPIAFVNGSQEVQCGKCGKKHQIYSESKVRFKMAAR